MNPRPQWRSALLIVTIAGLVLAACTRSASSSTVPTVTANANASAGGGQVPAQDATMAALGTSIRMTQTAQALVGSGGGGETTGTPPAPTAGTSAPGETSVPPTVVPATPIPATPLASGVCPNPYTVKKGDWIYKIARECKVDAQAIIALNAGVDPNKIYEGQKLNMPTAGSTAAAGAAPAKCTGTHTVVKGENLFRIAYNCGLTTEQMAAANGITYPYTIYPGQVLKFP